VLLQYHENSYFSFSCPFGWSVGLSLREYSILTILAKDINVGSIFYKIIKFKKLASVSSISVAAAAVDFALQQQYKQLCQNQRVAADNPRLSASRLNNNIVIL
jgi:hypothetical protein